MKVFLDLETYSPYDLTLAGTKKYATKAEIVIMAYAIDNSPPSLWTPNHPWPVELLSVLDKNCKWYAHNAWFDRTILETLGYPIPEYERWEDVMGIAQRYTYPGSLDSIGKILNIENKKLKSGQELLKRICYHSTFGCKPQLGVHYTNEDFQNLCLYCGTDIIAMREILRALPADQLSEAEKQIWILTCELNDVGVPVDVKAAKIISEYLEIFQEEMAKMLPELTGGIITKPTQTKRIKDYAASLGYDLPNVQADTVEIALEDESLPDELREVLNVRQISTGSSTAKFQKIVDMELDGYVHGSFCYHGANTGRWSGRGLQLHALPRVSAEDPDLSIRLFSEIGSLDDPVAVAKSLIRPMIKVEDDEELHVEDYSGIENCILPWIAEEEFTLESIRKGEDQYKIMASAIYGVPYDRVTKEQRTPGKIAELGCGFGMGHKRFVDDSRDNWKVIFSEEEGQFIVQAYRRKHYKIVQLWKALSNIVINAIQTPGFCYQTNRCKASVVQDRNKRPWLQLTLPSGRNLYYCEPFLEPSKYGWAPFHYGQNPKTKQWGKLALIPGRITENVVQATARDIMVNGMMNVKRGLPQMRLVMTVHDEAAGIAKKGSVDHAEFNRLLTLLPPWAEGLPLKAAGYVAQRYRKE